MKGLWNILGLLVLFLLPSCGNGEGYGLHHPGAASTSPAFTQPLPMTCTLSADQKSLAISWPTVTAYVQYIDFKLYSDAILTQLIFDNGSQTSYVWDVSQVAHPIHVYLTASDATGTTAVPASCTVP